MMNEPEIASQSRKRSVQDETADVEPLETDSSTTASLPPELASVDFGSRIRWGKFQPYSEAPVTLTPEQTPPKFTPESPALCHYIHAISHRARACTLHLQQQLGQSKATPVPTPCFMPVGTKGCLKGLSFEELTRDPALACPIILGNTYHLAIQPGTELIGEFQGLHNFQGLQQQSSEGSTGTSRKHSYNLLTDSGGFQMVSLAKLSQVTEEGVQFTNPFTQNDDDLLLLKPEDSVRHQNNLSANIIMALDDVVSSVVEDRDRFVMATYRTLRWYDRCYQAHAKKDTQNLLPIVKGGLDISLGGLREQCLAGFRHRQLKLQYQTPGFAIGGLAGGESKDQFWRVVDLCCKALPDDKPRYLMGVGYPLDLVVCTALGVDMYDCVYPTRTARFGVCLVPGRAPGTLKLKSHLCATDSSVIEEGCRCQACREGVSRSRLHYLLKNGNPLAVELVTQHNIAHMMNLVRTMRQAILDDKFADYAIRFVHDQFPGEDRGCENPPKWVVEALAATGIEV